MSKSKLFLIGFYLVVLLSVMFKYKEFALLIFAVGAALLFIYLLKADLNEPRT